MNYAPRYMRADRDGGLPTMHLLVEVDPQYGILHRAVR